MWELEGVVAVVIVGALFGGAVYGIMELLQTISEWLFV